MVRFLGATNRIRDVLYKDILLTDEELEIIKSPDFQRLQYVLQLPTVYKIYPGATHTRYSHSLGVLQVATNISMEIGFSEEDTRHLRIACLLHDIAELPFERVFEEYYIFPEEDEIRRTIVKRVCKDIGADWKLVWAILDGKRAIKKSVRRLYQILYSDVGANRIDYLRRDSFFSGVSYSFVDERIYSSFVLDESNDEILIKWPHLPVMESLFTGYYQLKHSVYDHKMVRSSLSLIRKAVHVYLERKRGTLRKLLVNEEPDKDSRWFLKTDVQLSNELRRADHKSIENFENGKMPRPVYDLDFYALKTQYRKPDILRSFESLRLYSTQIEKEVQDLCSFPLEFSFDVVSVVSLHKGIRSLRVLKGKSLSNGLKTQLWEVSRMLALWYQYFLEQWKLSFFCVSQSDEELADAKEKCKNVFDFLNINSKSDFPEKDYQISSLSELYKTVRHQRQISILDREVEETTLTFRDKILALSNERREILSLLCDKRQATANEIALIRKTRRETSTTLLRKLENDNLVLKKKILKKVYYFPRKEVEAALRSLSSDLSTERLLQIAKKTSEKDKTIGV